MFGTYFFSVTYTCKNETSQAIFGTLYRKIKHFKHIFEFKVKKLTKDLSLI